jgi:hypothetical protein
VTVRTLPLKEKPVRYQRRQIDQEQGVNPYVAHLCSSSASVFAYLWNVSKSSRNVLSNFLLEQRARMLWPILSGDQWLRHLSSGGFGRAERGPSKMHLVSVAYHFETCRLGKWQLGPVGTSHFWISSVCFTRCDRAGPELRWQCRTAVPQVLVPVSPKFKPPYMSWTLFFQNTSCMTAPNSKPDFFLRHDCVANLRGVQRSIRALPHKITPSRSPFLPRLTSGRNPILPLFRPRKL